jgi:hypothetical protein
VSVGLAGPHGPGFDLAPVRWRRIDCGGLVTFAG